MSQQHPRVVGTWLYTSSWPLAYPPHKDTEQSVRYNFYSNPTKSFTVSTEEGYRLCNGSWVLADNDGALTLTLTPNGEEGEYDASLCERKEADDVRLRIMDKIKASAVAEEDGDESKASEGKDDAASPSEEAICHCKLCIQRSVCAVPPPSLSFELTALPDEIMCLTNMVIVTRELKREQFVHAHAPFNVIGKWQFDETLGGETSFDDVRIMLHVKPQNVCEVEYFQSSGQGDFGEEVAWEGTWELEDEGLRLLGLSEELREIAGGEKELSFFDYGRNEEGKYALMGKFLFRGEKGESVCQCALQEAGKERMVEYSSVDLDLPSPKNQWKYKGAR